jgi:hypothetical protein
MQKELEFINSTSRVGTTCISPGGLLLGQERIVQPNQLSLSQLHKDQEGCVVSDKKTVIRVGGTTWHQLISSSFLEPGTELDIAKTNKEFIQRNLNFKTSTYPAVVLEQGVNPVLVVATPSSRPTWESNEQELARLALRRLISKDTGFELQHMLTMVLRSLLTGQEKELSLVESAHDTHHSKHNAKSAIARNFLRGSAKLGIMPLDGTKSDQWIVINHNGDALVADNIATKLSEEQEIQVLSNGIAVAVHHIISSGITQDNPDIKPASIGTALVDTALELASNTQSHAGDISDKLAKNLRSTRRI